MSKVFVGERVFSETANMGQSGEWGHQDKQNSCRGVFHRFLKG